MVLPAEPASTLPVGVVSVPLPSAALVTVIDGDAARLVSVPVLVDISCACQVCAPMVLVAVPPGPPEDLSP